MAGILLQWITNLFTNRLFCTRIDDLLSSFVNLISGVIQGSVIGPLTFLIYINDLATLLSQYNVKVKLFADDVTLYVRVVSNADITELQMALCALTSWVDYWQVSVSVDKCGVLHTGKHVAPTTLTINNIPLPVVTSYRDLGITITCELSSSPHINDIVTKAHRHPNMIHRCFVYHNINLLTRAFITYVGLCPLLEYNCVARSPHLKCDIELIEQVQHRFMKRLNGLSGNSYDERLKLLNLDSLQYRRTQFDIVMCYKIIFGLVCIDRDEFFQLRLSTTRGHPYKLHKHFSNCSARSSFSSEHVVNLWNSLPADCISFTSLSSFKNSLTTVDLQSLTL